MISSFIEYTEKIKSSVNDIPEYNKLFWGGWFCEYLFKNYGLNIKKIYSKEVFDIIKISLDFIWKIVDDKYDANSHFLQNLLNEISDIDDSLLDQLEVEQDGIYELIISLDAILNDLLILQYAFTYNVSQSTINVVDKILQKQGIDLTTDVGFNDSSCIEEVRKQFKMIDWLKINKASSQHKDLFR